MRPKGHTPGDFSSISIRGSTSEQVLVYIDGVLLNDAQGGGVNLGIIPASLIKEIEIYRGSSPLVFGNSGIGGVINIKTKEATQSKIMSAQLQYGSFNTFRFNSLVSHKPERWGYMLGLNYSGSDNDFKFLNNKGTQYDSSDDEIVKRDNNQFRSPTKDFFGRLSRILPRVDAG